MALLPEDPVQRNALLVGVLIAAGVYAFWTYYYTPQKEEIGRLETRLERLETQNRRARVMATQGREQLEQRLAVYERHIAKLEDLIPQDEEVPELLDAISLEARRADVELASMRPEPAQEGQFYTQRSYSLGVIGMYHDVGRFLTAVASLPRIITPVDVGVEPGPPAQGPEATGPRVVAQFRIRTYVVRPSRAAGGEGGRPSASD